MTEQTGQNPEVLQDPLAVYAGADPQPDIATVLPQQDPEQSAVAGEAIVEVGNTSVSYTHLTLPTNREV